MFQEMNVWICLLLFGIYFLYDALYAWFIISVQNLKAGLSSIISGAMYVISALGVIKYTENPWYLLPVTLGASLGTYIFILIERKKKKKSGK